MRLAASRLLTVILGTALLAACGSGAGNAPANESAADTLNRALQLHLQGKLETLPAALEAYKLELSDDGREVTYNCDTKGERTGITSLLSDLRTAGIRISDLDTRQSSLEDIFVSLVRAP